MFDRMDHPSVPTTFLGARRLVAVKDGRKATAKRRPASLRATSRRATLATGGHSVTLPLPTNPLQASGSGSGKPIKKRGGDPINYRAHAHQRYRHMVARGKLKQVVVTAIARELAGFVWSIACITSDPVVSNNVVTESYDEATATRDNVTMASEEAAQKVHRITPDTDRPRVPRHQSLEGTACRANKTRQTKAGSAERSRTG